MNAVITDALTAYLQESDTVVSLPVASTPVRRFVEECCSEAPDAETPSRELFEAFRVYAARHGLHPGHDSVFGAELRAVCPAVTGTRRRRNGKLTYLYRGIRLCPDDHGTVTEGSITN